jgi:hydroxypyruvate reductase
VGELVGEYSRAATELRPGEALVRAAEPSLRLPPSGAGRGGRAGHLGAWLARELPPGVSFLAGASDGVDGSSGAAGAVVDRDLGERVAGGWRRLAEALASFDTADVLREAGAAIAIGPTGVNLADVHVLARS